MSVIDKIVTEWAFRCKKGYPDMNNPADMKILKEIYSQFGIIVEEDGAQIDYDKEIVNLLATISDPKAKQAIHNYLVKLNKQEDESDEDTDDKIESILLGKKVTKQYAEYVTLLASKYGISKEVLQYLTKPTVTLQDLEQQTNLQTLLDLSKLPTKFLQKLAQVEGKGIGKGELALICVLKDCSNMGGKVGETQGDIIVGTKQIELKLGAGQLVPHHISGYSSKPVKELNNVFGDDLDFTERKQWPGQVQGYYNQNPNKDEYIGKVNKIVKQFYSNYVPPITKQEFETKGLARHIADELAKKYIGEGKDVMLINKANLNYAFIVTSADYEALADSNEIVVNYPDKLPRIAYAGQVTEK